jgi:hypothetical protein
MTTLEQTHAAAPVSGEQVGDDIVAGLLAAHDRGMDIELYLRVRGLGIAVEELAEVKGLCQITDYVYAREKGATHTNIVLVACDKINLGHYADACRHHITHMEFYAALGTLDPTFHARAASWPTGTTGLPNAMGAYVTLRAHHGKNHAQALEKSLRMLSESRS